MRFLYRFLDTTSAATAAATGATDASGNAVTEPTGLAALISSASPFLMIAVLGLVFYLFIYRPQKKQERQLSDMRKSLKVGDEISTNSGILGKVVQIKDDFIIIETGGDKTKLKLAKWAIRGVESSAEDSDAK